jgi:hypothetical protein
MGRIIKIVLILILLGIVGLSSYAYLGPMLGADFSAPQTEMRQKVILDAQ